MWQKNWFKIWNKNTDFEIKNLISNWVLFKNKLVNLMTVSQNFSECSTEHIKSFKEGLRNVENKLRNYTIHLIKVPEEKNAGNEGETVRSGNWKFTKIKTWYKFLVYKYGIPRQRKKIKSTLRYFKVERQQQPTPVLLPGKSHGQRSLVGCNPWGREESDTIEAT